MTSEFAPLFHQIVSAVVNGVYQGALVAAIVWLAFKVFRRMSATTRHAIGFVALLLVAALPVIHLVQLLAKSDSADDTLPNIVLSEEHVEPGDLLGLPLATLPIEEYPTRAYVREIEQPTKESNDVVDLVEPQSVEMSIGEVAEDAPLIPASFGTLFDRLTPMALGGEIPTSIAMLIVVVIGLLGLWRLALLAGQFVSLKRLKQSQPVEDEATLQVFDRIVRESNCRRKVRLLSSDQIHTPIAIGYFDPAVMLPEGLTTGTGAMELSAVLRHEVAHINRRDDWFNLVQQIVAAVCFFNPAIAWLSSRLTMDRELACDDHALNFEPSPETYAFTLTEFAGRSQESRWIAAPAAWNSNSQLKERINMILDPNRNTSLKLGKTSAGLLAVLATGIAGAAFFAAPRLVLAERPAQVTSAEPLDASGSLFAPENPAIKPPLEPSLPIGSGHGKPEGIPVRSSTLTAPQVRVVDATAPTPVIRFSNGHADVSVVPSVEPSLQLEPVVIPNVVVAQAPVAIPTEPLPPAKPRAPRSHPAPAAAPAHPEPVPHVVEDRSLERRLAELERRLEELAATQSRDKVFFIDPADHGGFDDPFGHAGASEFSVDVQWADPFGEEHRQTIERAVKEANKQVAQAVQQAEIASAQAERRVREKRATRKSGVEAQRNVLEARKRALELQMEELDRQMEALHEQVHSLDEQLHGFESHTDESFDLNIDSPNRGF